MDDPRSWTLTKRAPVIRDLIFYGGMGLLLGCLFFRQILISHFDLMPGDVGDARFNGVILEHWWQVFQRNAVWRSPPFFYPVQGVLGYSDAGFLNALPYAALRAFGVDPFDACQIVVLGLVAMGWMGSILFFRQCLNVSLFPALVGAVLFVFPNFTVISAAHTQLLAVHYIPYLVLGIHVFLRNAQRKTLRGTAAGIFVATMIPALFYTSYYVGWFSLFFCLLWGGVCIGWRGMGPEDNEGRPRLMERGGIGRKLVPYGVLSAICFIPFLMTYVPVLRQLGGRGYAEIKTMLPSLVDYVNVGASNWVWGQGLVTVFQGIETRPMFRELIKGLPVGLLLTFLVCAVYFIQKAIGYRQGGGSGHRRPEGELSPEERQRVLLAAGLSVAIGLAWLLMLSIEGYSLWWGVAKLVPGAGSIRVVYRFQHVLIFPLALIVALGLHHGMRYARLRTHFSLKRGILSGALAVLGVGLMVEQFNTESLANISKRQQRAQFARIEAPPPLARIFAIRSSANTEKHPFEVQIDAMIIAQKYGLKTLNGYSGQMPPGWRGMYEPDQPFYRESLAGWIRHHQLAEESLYFLDPITGAWRKGDLSDDN